MGKTKISNQAFIYPMPMVLVGAVVAGKVTYMPVAWVTRVNAAPPRMGVVLGKHHATNRGIREHGEFGLSYPSLDLIREVDYAGMVSADQTEKSRLFETFSGELRHAPMAHACPLTLACRVVEVVDQPTNELFIGDIVEAWCGEEFLTEGQPDIELMRTFTLTMPDKRFWSVGGYVGPAWAVGGHYKGWPEPRSLA